MPLSKYFGGKGASVMRDMKSRYGSEKGEGVFYGKVNKDKKKAKKKKKSPKKAGSRMGGMAVGMGGY